MRQISNLDQWTGHPFWNSVLPIIEILSALSAGGPSRQFAYQYIAVRLLETH